MEVQTVAQGEPAIEANQNEMEKGRKKRKKENESGFDGDGLALSCLERRNHPIVL